MKEVTVLELKSQILAYFWRCFGLVLRAVPGQDWVFQRVGAFEYPVNTFVDDPYVRFPNGSHVTVTVTVRRK